MVPATLVLCDLPWPRPTKVHARKSTKAPDSMYNIIYNGNMLRKVSDVLTYVSKRLTIRQHAQHLYNAKIQIVYPHFGRRGFWSLQIFQGFVNSTSTTLPRAAYPSHAFNNHHHLLLDIPMSSTYLFYPPVTTGGWLGSPYFSFVLKWIEMDDSWENHPNNLCTYKI